MANAAEFVRWAQMKGLAEIALFVFEWFIVPFLLYMVVQGTGYILGNFVFFRGRKLEFWSFRLTVIGAIAVGLIALAFIAWMLDGIAKAGV
ncbi:MAG: hypothetical protein IPP68_07520 [Elusimicrobia bacterium]|nr:hypothetical protein [Elusimicrobiota bacterium]